MKSPDEFYLETNGRIIDVDGSYGGQCWDLWALFCLEYVGRYFTCNWSGGAKDMWYHFDDLGLGEYFEKVPFEKYHELQDGDWLVWDAETNPLCWITKSQYGHIAMFRIYNSENPEQNIILTQNPNGNPNYTHQMVCDFLGFVGALRPKCYMQDKSIPNPVERDTSKNQFSINCDDTMRIRLDHSLNGEFIGFGKTGYYNTDPVNMVTQDGYQWYEIDKGKWCSLIPPYSEFLGIEQETPQNSTKDEDGTIIPKEPKTPENEPNGDKKQNVFAKVIKTIVEILRKFLDKGEK